MDIETNYTFNLIYKNPLGILNGDVQTTFNLERKNVLWMSPLEDPMREVFKKLRKMRFDILQKHEGNPQVSMKKKLFGSITPLQPYKHTFKMEGKEFIV